MVVGKLGFNDFGDQKEAVFDAWSALLVALSLIGFACQIGSEAQLHFANCVVGVCQWSDAACVNGFDLLHDLKKGIDLPSHLLPLFGVQIEFGQLRDSLNFLCAQRHEKNLKSEIKEPLDSFNLGRSCIITPQGSNIFEKGNFDQKTLFF